MGTLASIKMWQAAVLVGILVLGAGGGYGAFAYLNDSDEVSLESGQHLIPVQLGNLVNEVSVNGSVLLPNRETLVFGSSGTVAEILVVEGQRVKQGERLAAFDAETIAALDKSVAQARVNLRDAQGTLGDFQTPSDLEIAQAESKVSTAKMSLANATDVLDRLQNVTDVQMWQAESKVSGATQSLIDAEDTLSQILEPLTAQKLASAEAKVSRARLAVQNSEDALVELNEPPTAQELASAEAKVSSARLAVQKFQDALAELHESPTAQELASAEAKVSSARLAVQNSEDALAEFHESPTAQELAQAEARVTDAQLTERAAQEAFDDFKPGPSADEISDAQTTVTSAETQVSNAQADLGVARTQWTNKLDAAESDLQTRADDYMNEFKKWLGIELDSSQLNSDSSATLIALGVDLDAVFDPDPRFEDLLEGVYFSKRLPADNPSTAWNEPTVFIWRYFSPAQIIGTCDANSVPAPVIGSCVSHELDTSASAYKQAKDSLESLKAQSAKAIALVETNVNKTQGTLTSALQALTDILEPVDALSLDNKQRDLNVASAGVLKTIDDLAELKKEPDQLDIDDQIARVELAKSNLQQATDDLAELKKEPDWLQVDDHIAQVELAKSNLQQATDDLAELKTEPDWLQVDDHIAQVELAKSNLQQATDDLAELKTASDPADIDNQRIQIELAKANLADSQDELLELRAGPDPLELETRLLDVEVARLGLGDQEQALADLLQGPEALDLAVMRANLVSAQAALDDAEQRLTDSVITGPWDGLITFINAESGQAINPTTPIVEIVDTSVVEIDGVVDEIDVLFVRLGSSALVTMDALPGELLQGDVSFIATEPETQQGVVSFPIRIRISLPTGLELPEGLSAVANVVIREDRGVLMVPINSLYGSFEQPTVKVMENGQIVDKPVVLGNSDDFWIAVNDGVTEGDLVVMESQGSQSNQFDFGSNFRRIGGIGIPGIGGSGFRGGGGQGDHQPGRGRR